MRQKWFNMQQIMQFLWKRFYVELLLLLTTTVKISEVSHTFLVLSFNQRSGLLLYPDYDSYHYFKVSYGLFNQVQITINRAKLHLSVADPGEEPGGPAPPYFQTKRRPEGRKQIFWRPPFAPPPPPLSQGLDDRAPLYLKVWIRHCHCIISLRSPNMYIFLQGLMMRTNLRGEVGENLW